jgi:subfamily B ATP-binding cassette protein MsbA
MVKLSLLTDFWKLLKPIWIFIKPYRLTIVLALVLGALISMVHLLVVKLVGNIQDQILVGKDIQKLLWVSTGIVMIFLTNLVLRYCHRTVLRFVAEKASLTLRNQMFQKLLHMDLVQIHARSSGDILSRFLNDARVFHNGLEISSDLIKDGLSVLVLVTYAFFLNWQFSLAASLAAPFVGYIFYRVGTSARKNTHRSQLLLANLTKHYEESFSGIREIHIYQKEKTLQKLFDQENRRYMKSWMRVVRVEELAGPLIEFFGAVIGGILMWFGGLAIIRGDISSGEFISYLAALWLTQQPLRNLNRINVKLAEATAAAERISDFLRVEGKIEPLSLETTDSRVPPAEPKCLELQNVSFSYIRGHHALQNISLRFETGKKHAIVGPSGSGKSTLFNLLVRFYEPDTGVILLDNQDIKTYKPSDYRKLFSLVTQEIFLFHDTILENIRFSKPEASFEEVEEAAKMASAHEFIQGLPKGYQTVVGDRGIRLSGGQRQRISIARAFLKDSPVLMFDEATSHLDTESEKIITDVLARLSDRKTSFFIAHRLATVMAVDRIVVIREGQIVGEGTHLDLLTANECYRDLCKSQFLTKTQTS